MSFTRTVEDFICGRCGQQVCGNGYTNHCPKCLWSKHVDVRPGDRAEPCGGMMEPIGIEGSSPAYRIVHCCSACGATRRVNAVSADDQEALVRIARVAGN